MSTPKLSGGSLKELPAERPDGRLPLLASAAAGDALDNRCLRSALFGAPLEEAPGNGVSHSSAGAGASLAAACLSPCHSVRIPETPVDHRQCAHGKKAACGPWAWRGRWAALSWRERLRQTHAGLHQRWEHLRNQRRKPSGVVTIAVARELAGFLWEAATLD
jgi:hypothetical protein